MGNRETTIHWRLAKQQQQQLQAHEATHNCTIEQRWWWWLSYVFECVCEAVTHFPRRVCMSERTHLALWWRRENLIIFECWQNVCEAKGCFFMESSLYFCVKGLISSWTLSYKLTSGNVWYMSLTMNRFYPNRYFTGKLN